MWKRDLYILGARVDPVTMKETVKYVSQMIEQPIWQDKKQHHIVTTNPEIVLHSLVDDAYRAIIVRSSLSTADGAGLKIGARILGEHIPERVTGIDLMTEICSQAEIKGWKIFLLGGYGAAKPAADNLQKKFSLLKIVGAQDGLDVSLKKDQISYDKSINDLLINKINTAGTQILFVAFGGPKQEKWIAQNLERLPNVKLAMGVGGAFDFLSGRVKRAPPGMQKIGLEWLFRLIYQPRRFLRIFRATFIFISTVLFWKLRILTTFRPNVVGLIINQKNEVLLVAPSRHKYITWQFPQGGVDKGETTDQAILREMSEELGSEKFEILKKVPNIHSYIWPRWAQNAQGYKGQSQTLYILRFTGQDTDFDLEKDQELKKIRWVTPSQVLAAIEGVRRPVASKGLNELNKILK